MKKILLLCFTALIGLGAWAQNKVVSGKVLALENGSALPGVNVVVKGTAAGTVTDANGEYQLTVPSSTSTLVFSFIGMQTKESVVGQRAVLDVSLEADIQQLSEIVITGQGAGMERNRISTTVDVVNADKFKNAPVLRIDQMLQSQLPNTQINLSSSSPGTASVIRSRGVSSALKSSTPVIYIDGVRVDNLNTASALSIATGGAQSSALADIPVEDIDRIEFVKGGAATTLYGSDAANGVLQIFTKRGKANQSRIDFEAQVGSIQGTRDFFKYKETPEIGFRPGLLTSYRVGASGGSENLTYSFSSNVYEDNNFVEGLSQRRYNVRGSLNARVNDKLNYSMSTGYTNSKFTRLRNANSGFDRIYGIDQGQYDDPATWDEETRLEVEEQVESVTKLANFKEDVTRFQNSHSFVYNPINNVTVNATLGFDYRFSRQTDIITNAFLIAQGNFPAGTSNQGTITVSDRSFLTTTGSLNGQWTANASDFSFITSAGLQFFRDNDRQMQVQASNVTEGSASINNAATRTAQDFLSTLVNLGYYAAENVGFKNKYFIDLGMRIDYNTAFGKNIGGQMFPKAGFSYVLSDEPFMEGITSVLSFAKIRASYGEAGNFPPAFTRDRLIMVNAFNGAPAFQPGQPGDLNLKPERTRTKEFGTDLKFWKNRISVGISYFDAQTEDALFTAPFAPSQGDDNQTRNLGKISNKGMEFSTVMDLITNDHFDLSFNFSANTVKNLVVSSGGAPEFGIGGFSFLGSFVKEGHSVGYFRGGKPTFGEDGTVQSVQQNADLGSAIPKVFGSLGLNMTFRKRLSLFVSGDYQSGAKTVNPNEVLRYSRGLSDDRVPEVSQGSSFFDLAGVWVQNGDYLKVRNISVSYSIPTRTFFGGKVKSATVSFSALNPFNFMGSKGIDPEITGAGAPGLLPGTNTPTQQAITVGGFAYGTFSAPRQYIGTLRFTF